MGHMRDLLRSHPPTFDGLGTKLEAETWLIDLDRCFTMHLYGSNTVRCTIMHLKDFASTWWRLEEQRIIVDISTLSWEMFLERFRARFLSVQWRQCRTDEFYELRQLGMIVDQYEQRFYELKQYVEIGNDEALLVKKFMRGLNDRISGGVRVFEPSLVELVMVKSKLVEKNLARGHGVS
ncbi:uncharacterized protein LOC131856844 [Cryptomeria japonica]|uniref:uncharacterized protein LOC131856844 n=1 Tax=Cryptomeria japonica TaxID=3369 RepID=UPI0027DA1317|nr:uncharacterized protein LOC131856844 [Cryptomeria japonica]